MTQWHLGTIGYSYKEWTGGFYPDGTNPRDYLSYYSKVFSSVEVDTTFHAPPRRETVQLWKASVPTDFKFSFKTPHTITHEMRLQGAEGLMLEFLDTIQPLAETLGPILIQLPPSFKYDRCGTLQKFLEALPTSYSYAVELRHSSWYNNDTAAMLSQLNTCWVAIDFPNIPRRIIPTTSFLFVRWIGNNGLYQHHSYERVEKNEQLKWWLDMLNEITVDETTIYGYFNNDYTGFAAGTCKRFMMMAGLLDVDDNLPYQETLF